MTLRSIGIKRVRKPTCLVCYRLARAGAPQKTCVHCETKALYARKRKAERVTKKGYLP